MALSAAAVLSAATGGANEVLKYNRENFKYDREMRQSTEFKVLDFRTKQAEMWREDVRDLIGMTENRMDRYLVMNTLQLAMVLGLFTEGRLEAGTPQWLLRFYMLNLGSTFMYLLMSVWLAMHASVLAQTSGTRLLTQFVRLPVPTWKHLDKMRTFAASFETQGLNMLRVPFLKSPDVAPSTWNDSQHSAWASYSVANAAELHYQGTSGTPAEDTKAITSSKSMRLHGTVADVSASGSKADVGGDAGGEKLFDVWGLEGPGHDIEELTVTHPADRKHVGMVRDEAIHFQCHDIFCRVAMAMGTNHLIFAILYYCLGYLSIQDGAPMPSWCVAALLLCTGVTLIHLDFMIAPEDMHQSISLMIAGPCLVAFTTFLMAQRSSHVHFAFTFFLPPAYLAHAGWLFWTLQALGIEKHSNGAWLPMKFRPMSYLDVFHWYFHTDDEESDGEQEEESVWPPLCTQTQAEEFEAASSFQGARRGWVFKLGPQGLGYYLDPVQLGEDVIGMNEELRSPAAAADNGCQTPASGAREQNDAEWVRMHGHTDLGAELPYFYNQKTGVVRTNSFDVRGMNIREVSSFGDEEFGGSSASMPYQSAGSMYQAQCQSSSSSIQQADDSEAKRLLTDAFHGPATDYGKVEPGLVPWQMLRSATWMLIVLWCSGPLLSFNLIGGPLEYGMTPREFEDAAEANTDRIIMLKPLLQMVAGPEPGWMPHLEGGEEITVKWPRRNAFTPKSISCDNSGDQLVVADDFGLYKARLIRSGYGISGHFSRAPSCTAFEGQLLKDIVVVCIDGTSNDCRILALHNDGHEISECPLEAASDDGRRILLQNANNLQVNINSAARPQIKPKASIFDSISSFFLGKSRKLSVEEEKPRRKAPNPTKVTPIVTWKLAAEWMHDGKERVQSMAVNKFSEHCLTHATDGRAFLPRGPGCIVVGTTSGRVIGLRRHVTETRELVPEIHMATQPHPVVPGSLRILAKGIIGALRQDRSSIQAIAMDSGKQLGEWRLPPGISWITLCGAGRYLFVVGRNIRSRERNLVIWRFPLPTVLMTEESMAPQNVIGAQEI